MTAYSSPLSVFPRYLWLGLAALLFLAVLAVATWGIFLSGLLGPAREATHTEDANYAEPIAAKSSETLSRTVIVPTLDTPVSPGKSIIWCSSFQLAWNELKEKLAHGPVQLQNAQEVADRLNQAKQSAADVDTKMVYAAAGFIKDGIAGKIKSDMAQRFPKVSADLAFAEQTGDAAVAYAYLKAGVPFTHPYLPLLEGLDFVDSEGKSHRVEGFGIPPSAAEAGMSTFRKQIVVLYCSDPYKDNPTEFALDLCSQSQRVQVILAIVPRQKTLAEILASLQTKLRGSQPGRFGPAETLAVPNLAWHINHHFHELEGTDKHLLNPPLKGLYFAAAQQVIQFRLDKNGAQLESSSKLGFKSDQRRQFYFTRPFLIYLKKRGAEQPFFVAWIDNAELLTVPKK